MKPRRSTTGRREAPLPAHGPAGVLRLAQLLRTARERSGLSYREVSSRANYSAPALSLAASGKKFPSWAVTQAYLEACGATAAQVQKVHRVWTSASEELRELRKQKRAETPAAVNSSDEIGPAYGDVDLSQVASVREFAEALSNLRDQSGLTVREIIERSQTIGVDTEEGPDTGKVVQLKRSTVYDVLKTNIRPSAEFTTLYLRACGLTEQQVARWTSCLTELLDGEQRIATAFKVLKSGAPSSAALLEDTVELAELPTPWSRPVSGIPHQSTSTDVVEVRPLLSHEQPNGTHQHFHFNIQAEQFHLSLGESLPGTRSPMASDISKPMPMLTSKPADDEIVDAEVLIEKNIVDTEDLPQDNIVDAELISETPTTTAAAPAEDTTSTAGPDQITGRPLSNPMSGGTGETTPDPADDATARPPTVAQIPEGNDRTQDEAPRTHRKGATREHSYGRPPGPAIRLRWRSANSEIQLTVDREMAAAVLKLWTVIVVLTVFLVAYLR